VRARDETQASDTRRSIATALGSDCELLLNYHLVALRSKLRHTFMRNFYSVWLPSPVPKSHENLGNDSWSFPLIPRFIIKYHCYHCSRQFHRDSRVILMDFGDRDMRFPRWDVKGGRRREMTIIWNISVAEGMEHTSNSKLPAVQIPFDKENWQGELILVLWLLPESDRPSPRVKA